MGGGRAVGGRQRQAAASDGVAVFRQRGMHLMQMIEAQQSEIGRRGEASRAGARPVPRWALPWRAHFAKLNSDAITAFSAAAGRRRRQVPLRGCLTAAFVLQPLDTPAQREGSGRVAGMHSTCKTKNDTGRQRAALVQAHMHGQRSTLDACWQPFSTPQLP